MLLFVSAAPPELLHSNTTAQYVRILFKIGNPQFSSRSNDFVDTSNLQLRENRHREVVLAACEKTRHFIILWQFAKYCLQEIPFAKQWIFSNSARPC